MGLMASAAELGRYRCEAQVDRGAASVVAHEDQGEDNQGEDRGRVFSVDAAGQLRTESLGDGRERITDGEKQSKKFHGGFHSGWNCHPYLHAPCQDTGYATGAIASATSEIRAQSRSTRIVRSREPAFPFPERGLKIDPR